MAIIQQVYVVPFIGASLFFWHDLSYVLHYPLWFGTYEHHWWLVQWTYAQIGTVALEAFLLWQFIYYGHKELMPEASMPVFAGLTLLATLGVGAMWWLIKVSLADELYFVTQAITAVWSIPFHTGILLRRKSRAGQSIAMQLSVMLIFVCMSVVSVLASPFFLTPAYEVFFATFIIWPLVNIWLILRYPPVAAASDPRIAAAVA